MKIKNTPGNKAMFLLGFLILMGFVGYKLGNAGDKKAFTIGGVIVGLLIFSGVSSLIFAPKAGSESGYDSDLLIPGGSSSRILRIKNIR